MKLELTFHGPVEEDNLDRNREHAKSLGLPGLKKKRRRLPLAVVGGGPSVLRNVGKLRRWKGDIWASCSAWPWCRDNGIDATLFNRDPQPLAAGFARGARKAVVANCNDPAVFEALSDAEVAVFDTRETINGHTTVTAAPMLALDAGWKKIAFFGCDSSYQDQTHVYMNHDYGDVLIVKCGGELYRTSQALLGQAICLSEFIRAVPNIARCASGGLLAAMVKNPDYDVVGMSYATLQGMKSGGRPILEMGHAVPFRAEDHL